MLKITNLTSNRTIVELKCRKRKKQKTPYWASNRTIVELKCREVQTAPLP